MEDRAEMPEVPGVAHEFIDVKGLRTHVAVAGQGEPVVLLHGFPQHWYCWRKVAAELSGSFRLLMPDLRGFGWTDAPGEGYHPETFAVDIIRLLDVLDIERVRVIGHDWGGFTGFLLGLNHPERITSLLLCNTPHPWVRLSAALGRQAWRTWYVALLATPRAGRSAARSERFISWFVGLGGRRHAIDGEAAEIYARPLRDPARAQAMALLYRSYLQLTGALIARRRYDDRRLTIPTHLIFGREDFYIPAAALKGWEDHADAMTLELVDNCGHWTPEERPALVADRARALFRLD